MERSFSEELSAAPERHRRLVFLLRYSADAKLNKRARLRRSYCWTHVTS